MKPAAFEYVAATGIDDALEALAADEDARVLAGGQSLIPLMNLRLARPGTLVDINGVIELDYVEQSNGSVRIGALTRHRRLELDAAVTAVVPLFTEAAALVGHPHVRNRATLGGTLAHADPAAELSAALLALGGRVTVAGPRGRRSIEAADLFSGYFTTTLSQGELLVEVEVTAHAAGSGVAFCEFAPRHGDFAIAGVALVVHREPSGACDSARAACGLGATPTDLSDALEPVRGERELSETLLRTVARAVGARLAPAADVHGSAEYRRELAQMLVVDALRVAWRRSADGAR
jgi:carbon-monoxide dehydrogenase medium subunit